MNWKSMSEDVGVGIGVFIVFIVFPLIFCGGVAAIIKWMITP